jgi:hypothetical protein
MHVIIPCTQCYRTSHALVVTEVDRPLLYQLSFQQFSSMGPAALLVVEPLAKQVKNKNNKEAQREQGQASA